MRLRSPVLLCCVCLLSAAAAAAAQGEADWIDPFDMANYDAGSQTMRKEEIKKAAAESIPDPPKSSNWKNFLENPVLQLSVAFVVIILSLLASRRRRQVAPAADPQGVDGHGNVAEGDVMEQHRVDDAVLEANQPEAPHGVEENNGGDPQADIDVRGRREQIPLVQERISVEETTPHRCDQQLHQ